MEAQRRRRGASISALAAVATILTACGTAQRTTPAHPSPLKALKSSTASMPLSGVLELRMFGGGVGWGITKQGVVRLLNKGAMVESVNPSGINATETPLGYFLNPREAWLLAKSTNGTSATLFRTTDGGTTWLQLRSFQVAGAPFYAASMFFLGPRLGWLVVAPSEAAAGSVAALIYNTSNGGDSWHLLAQSDATRGSPVPFSGSKGPISFTTPHNGWLGVTTSRQGVIWLLQTKDGGRTWKRVNIIIPPSVNPRRFQMQGAVPIARSRAGIFAVVGYAVGGNKVFLFDRTTARMGWAFASALSCNTYCAYDVLNASDVWFAGTSRLYTTQDGGHTWAAISATGLHTPSVSILDFISARVGWAVQVGQNGRDILLETVNGGRRWLHAA